ncbi:MAG: histidinol dehydrogenase [Candidatus Dadabacteria bacterium]|nr:MAG: histidinol dehydrogenase [Candidatus Dadabacteria bacterium]
MLEVLEDGSQQARRRLERLARRQQVSRSVEPAVRRILEAVRRRGDRALVELARKLDGVRLRADQLVVPQEEIEAAASRVDPPVRRAIETACRRIARFHRAQRERGFELEETGVRLGMRLAPLERVGVYVPGGTAAYPSTVLMNVVPAKVAGVADITVATPPSAGGVRPEVLFAARLAGATRVVRVGGAQAIAALAYGTETIARVDKIVGPGNVYVATAKRLVFGAVDIDMVAGPSEVLIVADGSAPAAYVAADMLAQAEHDPLAAAICVTTSEELGRQVAAELAEQMARLARRDVAARSLRRYGTILKVASLERAAEVANAIAPEHLELMVRRPRRWLRLFRNAGAIFLGPFSAETLGDYAAGPNHVLPTGGTARFASPLGVYDFVKRTSIIEIGRPGLERLAAPVLALAQAEGLDAHAAAVRKRMEKE